MALPTTWYVWEAFYERLDSGPGESRNTIGMYPTLRPVQESISHRADGPESLTVPQLSPLDRRAKSVGWTAAG